MKATTNFAAWLAENHPETIEEIYCLHKAVMDRASHGLWDVSQKGALTFVIGPSSNLCLANDNARNAFLHEVNKLKDDPAIEMEAWYIMKCDLK